MLREILVCFSSSQSLHSTNQKTLQALWKPQLLTVQVVFISCICSAYGHRPILSHNDNYIFKRHFVEQNKASGYQHFFQLTSLTECFLKNKNTLICSSIPPQSQHLTINMLCYILEAKLFSSTAIKDFFSHNTALKRKEVFLQHLTSQLYGSNTAARAR